MGSKQSPTDEGPPWQGLAIIGVLLVAQTFTDYGWKGPWNDVSFTQGILGLLGGVLLYLAWFRWHFKLHGLLPTINRWKDPEKGMRMLALTGVITFIAAWIVGNPLSDLFPEPSGLLLGLVGLLMLLQSTYAWLMLKGILYEEE